MRLPIPSTDGVRYSMNRLRQLLSTTILAGPIAASSVAQPEMARLRESLTSRFPAAERADLSATPMPNLYELALPGVVVYVSADGRYLLRGRLIDLETGEDLTERVFISQRRRAIEDVPETQMIVFEADGEVRHTITTFTDVDCPYCRKMHAELDRLNASGVRVRYMLYPRAGLGSSSYEKAVSVWCAPDPQREMTRAKAGATLEKRDCPNPVREHLALARRLGLQGTPFTITDTGRVIVGYMRPKPLLESLESDKRTNGR